jgi:ferritin-like metal-binding protein YciE
MSERQDKLEQYVSDMLALTRHILRPIEGQSESDAVKDHPEARQLVSQIESLMERHISQLEQEVSRLGGDPASPIKEAVSSLFGVAAGAIDMVRQEKVSKMLRDDYTALHLAAMGYTMLHTTGLGLRDQQTADLALRLLKDVTPVLVRISELISNVVIRELADDVEGIDTSAADQARRNTQEAWSADHVHATHPHS